jgi:hypothetical protein
VQVREMKAEDLCGSGKAFPLEESGKEAFGGNFQPLICSMVPPAEEFPKASGGEIGAPAFPAGPSGNGVFISFVSGGEVQFCPEASAMGADWTDPFEVAFPACS